MWKQNRENKATSVVTFLSCNYFLDINIGLLVKKGKSGNPKSLKKQL